jgi:hypothetical protein
MPWIIGELISYSPVSWLIFASVAFCAARYFRWWCIVVGHLVVLAIVFFLDVRWLQTDGQNRDLDGPFLIGIFLHAFFINTVLLLVTGFGLWLRKRSRPVLYEPKPV